MTDEEFEKLNSEILARSERRRKIPPDLLARRSRCRDCDCADPEFYMVSKELWRSAFPPSVTPTGCLCLNCLEKRLSRRLEREEIADGTGGLFNGRQRKRRKYRHPV